MNLNYNLSGGCHDGPSGYFRAKPRQMCAGFSGLNRWWVHFAMLLLLLVSPVANAQSVQLINPAAEGGFENGSTLAANGWTAVHYDGPNQWVTGTVPGWFTGTNGAYISNDGTAWEYSQEISRSHFYRDVAFPAGLSTITLSFDIRSSGADASWDNILVYLVDTNITPDTGSPSTSGTTVSWTGYTSGTTGYNLTSTTGTSATTTKTVTYTLTAAQATYAMGKTKRLVFTWKNDGSLGSNPPMSIDNIKLTASCTAMTTNAATSITAFTATANWPNVTGATAYEVRYKVQSSETWQTVSGIGTNSTGLTSLLADSAYEYQVRSNLCDVWSASRTFTTLQSCFAPTGLTSSAITGSSVTINWTAATQNTGASYVYEVRTSGTGGSGSEGLVTSGTVASGVTTVGLTSLPAGSGLTFNIRSNCGPGDLSRWAVHSFRTIPANDNCSDAIVLNACTGGPQSLFGTSFGATLESHYVSCGTAGSVSTERGVWYKYIGDNSEVTINTCGDTTIGYDTRLTVYTGTCTGLECVTFNEDMSPVCPTGSWRSAVTFSALEGIEYLIFVHGYQTGTNLSTQGDFQLNWTCAPLCMPESLNDECATATTITVGTNMLAQNTCATPSLGVAYPSCGSSFGTFFDSWYQFNSGSDTALQIGTIGQDDAVVGYALYTGVCGSLTQVSGLCSSTGALANRTVAANTDYYLRVFSTSAATRGAFNLIVRKVCNTVTGVTAANITHESATINWTASTSTHASGYEYEIRTTGSPGSETGLLTSGSTEEGVTSVDITDLPESSTIRVFVRAVCGDYESNWTTVYTFTTPASCIPPTALTVTLTGATTAQAVWTPAVANPEATYEYALTTTTATPESGTAVATPSVTLSDLVEGTLYYLHVRSQCAEDDFSTWTYSSRFVYYKGDTCADAYSLDAATSPLSHTTVGATDDFDPSCNSTSTTAFGPDRFYSLTVLPGFTAEFTVSASNFDVVRSLAVGNCGALESVACTDTNNGTFSWTNESNETRTVYFVMDAWSTASGTYTFDWDLIPPPIVVSGFTPESVCSNELPSSTVTLNGSNFDGVTSVTLNGAPVAFTVISDTEIEVALSASATSGTFELTDAYVSGTSSEGLIIINSPVVTPILNGGVDLCTGDMLDLDTTSPGGLWSSSNEDIATVDGDGIVTTLSAGEVTIYYTVTENECPTTVSTELNIFEPVMVSNPANQTVVTGANATFSVTATGAVTGYQWMISTDFGMTFEPLSDDATYSGVNTNTLTVTAATEMLSNAMYMAVVSAQAPCFESMSGAATLIVGDTGISAHPESVTRCNTITTPVQFDVVGTGENLTYQWQMNDGLEFLDLTDGTFNGLTFSGTTTPTLTVEGLSLEHSAFEFRAVVTGIISVESNVAVFFTQEPMQIVAPAQNALVCESGGSAEFAVEVIGAVEGYAWSYSVNGIDFSPVVNNVPAGATYSGTTSNVLNVQTTDATPAGAYMYKLTALNSVCGNVESTVTLNVNTPAIVTAPVATPVYAGESNTVSVVANLVGAATYQWEFSSTVNGTYAPVANNTPAGMSYSAQNTATLSVSANEGAVSASGFVRVKVTSAAGCSVYSTPVALSLVNYCIPTTTGTATYITNFTTTGGATNLNNTTELSTGNYGDYTAQSASQYVGFPVSFSSTIQGGSLGMAIWIDFNNNRVFEASERVFATTSYSTPGPSGTFTIPAATTPGTYRMRVLVDYNASSPTNSCGFAGTRGEAEDYTFTVLAIPACDGAPVASVVTGYDVCSGESARLIASNPDIVSTGYTYQWHNSQGPIAGATGFTYATPALTSVETYFFRTTCTESGLFTDSNVLTIQAFEPQILSTEDDTVCGAAPLTLSATASPEYTVVWYDAPTGGNAVAEGETFSPEISETTSFYAQAERILWDADSALGVGASTSSSAGQSPYYHGYGGQKAQYIYRASELIAAGFKASQFKSLSFFVTSLGTSTLNGFSIRMGHTTQTEAVLNTAIASGLSTVYTGGAQTITAGLNTYAFTQPFNWDGTSNIVVEVVYSNNNTGGVGSSVRTDATSYNATLSIYADNATAAAMLAAGSSSTALGTSRGNTRSLNRPQTWFSAEKACRSERVEVVATITEAPEVALNEDKFTMCEGDTSDVFTITSGLEDYDTFVWSPTEGVSGDATSGYVFNPTVSTVYTLTASNEDGCAALATVNITINPLPGAITAFVPEVPVVCSSGAPIALTAIGPGLSGYDESNPTTTNSSTPYRGNYTAHKNQALYTAAELIALGFEAGQPIYGLGYDVTSFTGSYTFSDFTIAMKHTTVSALTATWQTGLTTVKNPHAYVLSGTAPFTTMHVFDTPFVWDGTSNIIVETCFRNADWESFGLASVAASTSTGRSAYFSGDGATALTVCSNPGTGLIAGPKPNIRFLTPGYTAEVVWSPTEGLFTDEAGTVAYTGGPIVNVYAKPSATTTYTASITSSAGCSVSNEVTVSVLESDPVVLSQDTAAYCEGGSVSVQIVSGAEGYDSFVWSPATGVSGDPVSGYVFNADASTLYTLTASNAAGCEFETTFAITVNAYPDPIEVSPASPEVCSNGNAVALVVHGTLSGTIGNGTVSNTTTTPYKGFWGKSKAQFLYTAAELSGMGLTAGSSITALGMDVTSFTGPYTFRNFTIAMKLTPISALTSTMQTGMTTVKAPHDFILSGSAPFSTSHQLDTPFVWDGVSNLVVETCFNNTSAGASANSANVRSTSVTGGAVYSSSDAVNSCASTTGTTSTSRPNVTFTALVAREVVWSPMDGLYTDAAAAVPYDGGSAIVVYAKPETATTYTITETSNGCAITGQVEVVVNQATEWFVDEDGDGYGNSDAETVFACEQPEGYSAVGGDCNDEIAAINPGRNEVLYNGIDDNCDGQLDEGFQILSQVKADQCGTTLQSIYTPVNVVAKTGATAYRIKVLKVGEPEESAQIIERNTTWFNLTMLASYDYASTYEISVEVQRNGVWLGYYGPVCQVSTPAILDNGSLVVNPTVCGQTLDKIYRSINGTILSGATGYRFRVTDLTNDPHEHTVQVIERHTHWFSLDMLPRFNYGTTYAVEVAVKTTGDYTGYSAPCTVTTPDVPTLENCGTPESPLVVDALHRSIHAKLESRTTMYRYQITDMETFETQIIDRSSWFAFQQISGVVPGKLYRIRVAVMTAGTWSVFGEPCYVSFQPGAAMRAPEATLEAFTASAAPSPFANDFGLNIKGMSANVVTVSVYDMIGKLLEQRQIDPTQIEAARFGERFPAGVYNVVISQDENVKTLRVIKR